MGLDMYLKVSYYLSDWSHDKESDNSRMYRDLVSKLGAPTTDRAPSLTVNVNCVYWRRANAIHKWFVDTLANGVDECQPIYVTKENLHTLVSLCEQVLADPTRAEELLPTTSGFFFGGTAYDEWYMEDIKHTKESLDRVISETNDTVDFEYVASW